MLQLADYEKIVGSHVLDELKLLARSLAGKKVVHVNSTAVGGGVAEILNHMAPLLNELGVQTRWEVIRGGEAFYAVTKKMHNALHGAPETFTESEYATFLDVQEKNMQSLALADDIVFIHDPQPIGLVKMKKGPQNKWLWRCHVDVSKPNPALWNFLKTYVVSFRTFPGSFQASDDAS